MSKHFNTADPNVGSDTWQLISIRPELNERALAVIGERTKKAAVKLALEEFIARRRQRGLLGLMGKLEWDSGASFKSFANLGLR